VTPCTVALPIGTYALRLGKMGCMDIVERVTVKEDTTQVQLTGREVPGKSLLLSVIHRELIADRTFLLDGKLKLTFRANGETFDHWRNTVTGTWEVKDGKLHRFINLVPGGTTATYSYNPTDGSFRSGMSVMVPVKE